MNIFINNTPVTIPADINDVAALVKFRNIPEQGTAIAINGRLSIHKDWCLTKISDGDNITVISAAFGG